MGIGAARRFRACKHRNFGLCLRGDRTQFLRERLMLNGLRARPRSPVIALVGDMNQSLPLLVLADGETHQTDVFQGRAFISEKDKILAALSERHGFPDPHP